jgi:ketosteroid isomerase-like protein
MQGFAQPGRQERGKRIVPAGPEVRKFADGWVQAWNSHDLDVIMSHHASEVVLTSPVAAKLFDESGIVAGKEQLRGYFKRGLEAYPKLAFETAGTSCGVFRA